MFDTFQISRTFARPPDQTILENNGWKPIRDKYSGDITALCFNSRKGEHKPRLTLSQNRNDYWIIRAEVSPGSWLFGSNLFLPNDDEMNRCLGMLSEFVGDYSGITFNAHTERVTRVDFTRDFRVDENSVLPIIANFSKITLEKYLRVCYGETTVSFRNKGKEKTKQYLIYSKYHERLAKSGDPAELELAKDLIRLEISLRKTGVNRLAKSLNLESHCANHILKKEVSDAVIQSAMDKLHFNSLLSVGKADFTKLFEMCDSTSAFSRVGYLYVKDKCGENVGELPFVKASPKTLKRYEDDCRKAGILSLE